MQGLISQTAKQKWAQRWWRDALRQPPGSLPESNECWGWGWLQWAGSISGALRKQLLLVTRGWGGRVVVSQRELRRADTTSAPCPSLWCHSGLAQVSIPRFCASDTHLRSSLQVPLSFCICVMGIILKSPPRAEGGFKRGSTARELEWCLAHCGGSESV